MPSNPRSMRSGPDGTSRPEAVTGRPAGAAATPNRPRGVLVFAANGWSTGRASRRLTPSCVAWDHRLSFFAPS